MEKITNSFGGRFEKWGPDDGKILFTNCFLVVILYLLCYGGAWRPLLTPGAGRASGPALRLGRRRKNRSDP